MNAEFLGIAASSIILISGLMQSEMKLRVIDAVGSIMMAVYGILVHAPSVIFLNGALTLAHLYRIWRLKKKVEDNAKRNAPEQPQGIGRE